MAESTKVFSNVEERSVDGRGQALYATTDLQPGDVILEAPPLFSYNIRDAESTIPHLYAAVVSMCNKAKVEASCLVPAVMMFVMATENKEDQGGVYVTKCKEALRLFCPSTADYALSSEVMERGEKLEKCIAEVGNLLKPAAGLTVHSFRQLVLIWEFNGVEISNPVDMSIVGAALVPTFCRINHSCYPTAWHHQGVNFNRVVRAVRPIKKGEEITISYLADKQLLESATVRNSHLLPNKLFVCKCERCITDLCRQFTCIRCKGSCLPTYSLPSSSSSSSPPPLLPPPLERTRVVLRHRGTGKAGEHSPWPLRPLLHPLQQALRRTRAQHRRRR